MPALQCVGIASIQLPVSLLDQTSLPDFLQQAAARRFAVIASTPLGQGLLTTTTGQTKADESSHFTLQQLADRRRQTQYFRQQVGSGRSLAQTALRFALQLQGVSVAIPSAVTLPELEENIATLKTPPLSATELRSLTLAA
jgi:aryl-alcohol dehydrogenase-like predicted oxidoreductase